MSMLLLLLGCQGKSENVGEQRQQQEEAVQNRAQNTSTTQKKEHIPNPPFPANGGPEMKRPVTKGLPPFKAEPTYQWASAVSGVQKNIILISLDTVHARRMGIYGGRAKTPNLREFSESAILFQKAISNFPETSLSHWSMMTGVLPEVHGNVPANGGSRYTGPTLAEIAKSQDYATAAFIGGITMTDQSSGFSRGFDLYDDQFPFKIEDMARDGNEVTRNALQWIQQQKKPYFVFAHYFDAHFPYTPKQNLYDPDYKGQIDGSDRILRPYRDGRKVPSARDIEHVLALYDAEITELDEKIAPLLGLADENTIVVVTSDHGESFSHNYYFNHRGGLWDEITHVPLLISHSEEIKIPEQVGLIDLLPTVLDLANLPKDKRMQGESQLELLQKEGEGKGNEYVYSITDPWMPNPQFAVRSEQWKWIRQEKRNLAYDLKQDPFEQTSLATVPEVLLPKEKKYAELIMDMRQWQVESPRRRKISDEECKRLMLLGYKTCDQP